MSEQSTASIDDPIAMLSRALNQAGAVIAGVRPEQAAMPTPCPSWDVRTLVNHVVDEIRRFAEMTNTGKRGTSEGDVIGDNWMDAYRVAADSLLAAWQQPGAMDRTHRMPGGEIPASWAVGQHITELVIHTWDIAKATGQPTDLDPQLGHLAFEWAVDNLRPECRGDETTGHHIGPEVTVRDDAPLYERLATFSGRDLN